MTLLRKLFGNYVGPRAAPRTITAVYIIFGTLWIYLSDTIVEWLAADIAELSIVQTGKGLFYIVATAFLVYWLSLRSVQYAAHRAAQQELALTRKRMEKVLASLGEAVLVIDPDTRAIVQCNPAAERMFGFQAAELVGQDTRIIHVSDQSFETFARLGEPVLEEFGEFRTEYTLRRKDGTHFACEISVHPLEEGLAWQNGVVSVIRDISLRKKAEKESRDQFARLTQLVERLPEAVYIKDLELRYVLINNAAARMAGVNPEAVHGHTDAELLPGHVARGIQQRDRQALAEDGISTYEELIADRDGVVRHLLTSKGALYDSTGKPNGLFGISRDITESVSLRTALEERVKELRALFETTKCLAQVEIPFEARLEQLLRVLPPGWQCPEQTEARLTFEDLVLATPNFRDTPWMQSSTIYRSETEIGKIEIALTQHPTDPGTKAFLQEEQDLLDSVARAVGEAAERKRLEEQFLQAQKLESVGRLAGGVAHDFNNMLSVILGHCELILTEISADSTLHDEIEEILRAGQRAAELTHQLLAFSRQEVAKPVLFDLNGEIGGMFHMLKRLLTEDIELAWNPCAECATVHMDPGQVQQILVNLVVNARDAISGAGRIILSCDRRTLTDMQCNSLDGCLPGTYVSLSVTDTGVGMDAATQAKVFEPFFTTKPEGQGTGLGLAMVYGIVRQNRGCIRILSTPGAGSTFEILLPHATGHVEQQVTISEADNGSSGTETILLVEDEEQILRLNARTIEGMGYNVQTASDPKEALKNLQESSEPLDLLITDIVMPGMNGRDLYEEVARIRPGVKCLYTSGYTADVIADRGILEADVNFLQKPFSRRTLAARIRQILES